VSVSAAWFRRGISLLLVGFAVASLNTGCCSTNNNSTPRGATSSKSSGSSWSLFAPEPKKIQTTSDFIGLKRPE
jgi:hypothetical protein